MLFYRGIRPLLFSLDPEKAHQLGIRTGSIVQSIPGVLRFIRCDPNVDPILRVALAGIDFANPIGLAAGLDKSGEIVPAMQAIGFGHLEIGSISARPSKGNQTPRLWRLIDDAAVLVHYGLPNDGSVVVAKRLQDLRNRDAIKTPIGVNLVNTNEPSSGPSSPDAVIDDYRESAKRFADVTSYLMLNLSCPNTIDGRGFFEQSSRLDDLLRSVTEVTGDVPVFLKLSPDWEQTLIADLLDIALQYHSVAGVMFNLSAHRREGLVSAPSTYQDRPGAIAGRPTKDWMDRRTAWLFRQLRGTRLRIISAGGIQNATDAYRRIRLGASLVQVYTALIYHGPGLVAKINRDLAERLRRDGVNQLSDVIGIDAMER
ncbi:quinone-dependent dihydroorotate dehydrogenase [Roseiconus lacunae]|uniref:quinone-dependent dihydroorotate dehydrogenase n=1 Tax=Roseiconus lacunae TaxID=2605694 RepID=UPI0011F1F9A4|nr:quinone-dependent dihydroorotate dehydrogenase [Roseiconus lacunae]